MSATATGLQLNWGSVSVGVTDVDRVESFDINPGIEFIDFSADNDRYITCSVQNMAKPTGTIVTADIAVAMGLIGTTDVTTTATHLDAKGVTVGDIIYTCVGTQVMNVTPTGPYGQYGKATVSLKWLSTDGTTSPISFARGSAT